jgi:hypothetical protein
VSGLYLRHFPSEDRERLQGVFEPYASHQDKHHRWSLDPNQILQYGLGSRLPISRQCWEWTQVLERRIHFWTFGSWLTWAPLICEDLARQDPVSEIIRSVAPNLVIALLMDGPQLQTRWPARFASVLAEDPGSSVLTVTSLGMSQKSKPIIGDPGSRVIALWRDYLQGFKELAIPPDSDCAVLSISPHLRTEWTADGRSDEGVSSTPIFAGFMPIRTLF